jgi:hypothetical protein
MTDSSKVTDSEGEKHNQVLCAKNYQCGKDQPSRVTVSGRLAQQQINYH